MVIYDDTNLKNSTNNLQQWKAISTTIIGRENNLIMGYSGAF